MKKITSIILGMSLAVTVNFLCIDSARGETDIDNNTIILNNNEDQKNNNSAEVLGYEEVSNLTEDLITSEDRIYTEQN